jgi:hypothetical protein
VEFISIQAVELINSTGSAPGPPNTNSKCLRTSNPLILSRPQGVSKDIFAAAILRSFLATDRYGEYKGRLTTGYPSTSFKM